MQEVYEISSWQHAGTTRYKTRQFDNVNLAGRWEFVGAVAPEPIRSRYVGASVSHYLRRGAQNPVAYLGIP